MVSALWVGALLLSCISMAYSSMYPAATKSQEVIDEVYEQDYIHIVFAIEESLLPALTVAMASIVQSSRDSSKLYFHIITTKNLAPNKVTAFIPKCLDTSMFRFDVVEWVDIPAIIRNMKVRHLSRMDLASDGNYVRFYVSKMYPNIERFLYFDIDIVVSRDVKELWDTDLGNNVFGLRNNCNKGFMHHMLKTHYNASWPFVAEKIKSRKECFPNAGVMVVNQKRYNELGILKVVEGLIELNSREFVYNLGSQPLIVLSAWDLYTPFPLTWNYGRVMWNNNTPDCCALIHFTGSQKPWDEKIPPSRDRLLMQYFEIWRNVARGVMKTCAAHNTTLSKNYNFKR